MMLPKNFPSGYDKMGSFLHPEKLYIYWYTLIDNLNLEKLYFWERNIVIIFRDTSANK